MHPVSSDTRLDGCRFVHPPSSSKDGTTQKKVQWEIWTCPISSFPFSFSLSFLWPWVSSQVCKGMYLSSRRRRRERVRLGAMAGWINQSIGGLLVWILLTFDVFVSDDGACLIGRQVCVGKEHLFAILFSLAFPFFLPISVSVALGPERDFQARQEAKPTTFYSETFSFSLCLMHLSF